MSAAVIPFPAARRRQLVFSIARRALELSLDAGEKHICHSLEVQTAVMRRKGIAEHLIVSDVSRLDAAMRALIWSAVMRPREEC